MRLPNRGFAVRTFSDRRWQEVAEARRALLEGCGNPVPLDTFDRLWTAGELARRWPAHRAPGRDGVAEHRRPEEAALASDAAAARRGSEVRIDERSGVGPGAGDRFDDVGRQVVHGTIAVL
ncbi:hypothetical protein GCM10022419_082640 [Nonomuraea rosea]|uniref:GntR C-terminal domain-containing protein n=1 Tax=Nonomuraea rosea TaxID=638574 RepID=A0ABP6YP95_9ACTN